ncbi:hypothetical protein DBV15_00067 [Temnothorax longispinosus]|uniref:Uncharacterized protein n=1 Tax=Temnothorax longispinosus TaxID=300112 RepID=A0A4S2KDQ6_9HYME|nr:hypothetical protein DBV15_00067 [Temnothorax longispinosus]
MQRDTHQNREICLAISFAVLPTPLLGEPRELHKEGFYWSVNEPGCACTRGTSNNDDDIEDENSENDDRAGIIFDRAKPKNECPTAGLRGVKVKLGERASLTWTRCESAVRNTNVRNTWCGGTCRNRYRHDDDDGGGGQEDEAVA